MGNSTVITAGNRRKQQINGRIPSFWFEPSPNSLTVNSENLTFNYTTKTNILINFFFFLLPRTLEKLYRGTYNHDGIHARAPHHELGRFYVISTSIDI